MKLEHEPELRGAHPSQLAVLQMIHPPSRDLHDPGVGVVECPENVQKGAFPGPRCTYDSQNCATLNLEVHPLKDLQGAQRRTIGLPDPGGDQSLTGLVIRNDINHFRFMAQPGPQVWRRIASTGSSLEARQAG